MGSPGLPPPGPRGSARSPPPPPGFCPHRTAVRGLARGAAEAAGRGGGPQSPLRLAPMFVCWSGPRPPPLPVDPRCPPVSGQVFGDGARAPTGQGAHCLLYAYTVLTRSRMSAVTGSRKRRGGGRGPGLQVGFQEGAPAGSPLPWKGASRVARCRLGRGAEREEGADGGRQAGARRGHPLLRGGQSCPRSF